MEDKMYTYLSSEDDATLPADDDMTEDEGVEEKPEEGIKTEEGGDDLVEEDTELPETE